MENHNRVSAGTHVAVAVSVTGRLNYKFELVEDRNQRAVVRVFIIYPHTS
jgi:hypothetical protein